MAQKKSPIWSAVSALDHLLDGRQTIGTDCDLFPEQTWKLHLDMCAFTNAVFY